jgi:c-di-GMP-binding flagellar brake protein YcgR
MYLGDSQDVKVRFKKTILHTNMGEVRNQAFLKFCFDISADGLSFLITKNELKCFMVREEIRQIELFLGKQILMIDGKIINLVEIGPNEVNRLMYKSWKVCIKFLAISPQEMEKINLYIFKHSAQIKEVSDLG